jgi:hypothetical protein
MSVKASIEVSGVHKRFGSTVALDGMTFTVAADGDLVRAAAGLTPARGWRVPAVDLVVSARDLRRWYPPTASWVAGAGCRVRYMAGQPRDSPQTEAAS